jgi:hypothetical protein
MNIEEMTDLEFQEILKQCIERLENEKNHHVMIEGKWNHALIIIDYDDEVNDQLNNPHTDKGGWFDFNLMLNITKKINL